MPSRSRSRSRSPMRDPSQSPPRSYRRSRSIASRRSPTPRDRSRSPSRGRSRTRTPPGRSPSVHSRREYNRNNGYRGRSVSRSRSRSPSRPRRYSSRSPSRGGRSYRGRSYTRSPSPVKRSAKIVVEKLTKNVTEDHLREIFGAYGDIKSLELPLNRQFMTNRGSAFIQYYEVIDAEAAISHMHEAQLDGAVLNVSIVLPRRTFSRSPPPARLPSRGVGFGRFGDSGRAPLPPVGPPGRFRSPPPRGRRRPRGIDRHDLYRPGSVSPSRSRSRSRSPRYRSRTRSPSYSRSPPRRRGGRRDSPPRYRRRSSYSSYSARSRSRGRSRSMTRSRSPGFGGRR